MSGSIDKQYRVQISGPQFHVSCDAGPHEDDDAHLAAIAISGAIAMAPHRLPWVTKILAEVVNKQKPAARPFPSPSGKTVGREGTMPPGRTASAN